MKGQKIFTNYFLYYTEIVFTIFFTIFALISLIISFPFMLVAWVFRKIGEFFYQPWVWLRWKPKETMRKK